MSGTARQRPFDAGLQLERTALSWRRTVLSLAVASLAGAKVLFAAFGYGAIVVGAVGVALALVLRGLSERRYRRAHHRLVEGQSRNSALPDAVPLAFCVAVVGVAGVVALAYVLVIH